MANRKPTKRRAKRMPLTKKQAQATRNLVKKEIKKAVEWKHFLMAPFSGNVTDTGVVKNILSGLANGTSDNTRLGDQITVGKFQIKYQLTNIAAGADSVSCRLMIIQMNSGDQPTIAQLWDAATSNNVVAFYNTDTQGVNYNYRVLYDKTHTIVKDFTGQTKDTGVVKLKIRPPKRKLTFQEGSNVVIGNNVWAIWASDQATNQPTIQMDAKVYFADA